MGLDEIQSTWQSHDHGQRLTIDIQLLLKEVRRNHRAMESFIATARFRGNLRGNHRGHRFRQYGYRHA